MIDPQPPRSRHPPRTLACAPTELIGADRKTVLQKLGRPDAREAGRYWQAAAASPPGTVERDPAGNLRAIAVFGPVPQRIAPGTPDEAWTYRNAQGLTWILYFAAPAAGGPRELVEVIHYPEGAVF